MLTHSRPVEDLEESGPAPWMEGAVFRQLAQVVARLPKSRGTVLLEGERGVRKNAAARFLHVASDRRHRPFVTLNCAVLPPEQTEAELFGQERQGVARAERSRPGKIEFAHGGTLFLDEVAHLTPPLQAKLLHLLIRGESIRLGCTSAIAVDVMIIAATDGDLEAAARSGWFRLDLCRRLGSPRVRIPPLRERRGEIPALAEHFRQHYSWHYGRETAPLSSATLAHFSSYAWPGNDQELEGVVRRIVVQGTESFVPAACPAPGAPRPVAAADHPTSGDRGTGGLKQAARRAAGEAERALIRGALEETRWNRAQAARLLGIGYKALLHKIRAYGL